jgi:hypothetical protein
MYYSAATKYVTACLLDNDVWNVIRFTELVDRDNDARNIHSRRSGHPKIGSWILIPMIGEKWGFS